ncbi:hypothetical protein TRFO_06489 [Tritrichomonas foetus]|uniref:Uncharacterized protein n=1 Tax=Tritrichomonas foetus TaxID=1144522 RepID=A0A1J4JYC2_9EUKA|nr:hypothetical protein TRFO_06489 [Tritrichomonas foetus]|eukprot:OHT04159.1 hypothetical protein TRFO_06489 [Tritrichomonas foetus]
MEKTKESNVITISRSVWDKFILILLYYWIFCHGLQSIQLFRSRLMLTFPKMELLANKMITYTYYDKKFKSIECKCKYQENFDKNKANEHACVCSSSNHSFSKQHVFGMSYVPPKRKRNIEVSFVIFSGKRLKYLNRTLSALYKYLNKYDQGLSYETIWVDTATEKQRELYFEYQTRFKFDKIFLISSPSYDTLYEGIPMAYYYGTHASQGKYVFYLEDDMVLIKQTVPNFFTISLEYLRKSPKNFLGFLYRDDAENEGKISYDTFEYKNKKLNVTLYTDRPYQFNNGASLYKLSLIHQMLPRRKKQGLFECDMSRVARDMGLSYGTINFNKNCKDPSLQKCQANFCHIGVKSARTGKSSKVNSYNFDTLQDFDGT